VSIAVRPGGGDAGEIAHVGQEVLRAHQVAHGHRSEEHTSELQSLTNLVCRLLLEKKKTDTCQTADLFACPLACTASNDAMPGQHRVCASNIRRVSHVVQHHTWIIHTHGRLQLSSA